LPVRKEFEANTQHRTLHVPRVLGWVTAALDKFMGHATQEIRSKLGESARDFSRVAALVEDARIHDPQVRSSLSEFVEACYVPALAMAGQNGIKISEPENVLFDEGLIGVYSRIKLAPTYDCVDFRGELLAEFSRELSRDDYHAAVLAKLQAAQRQSGSSYDFRQLYLARLVKNTMLYVDRPTLGELGLAHSDLKTRFAPIGSGFAQQGLDFSVGPVDISLPIGGKISIGNGIDNLLKGLMRLLTDVLAYFARYVFGYAAVAHVVAFGPAFYGFVLMIVLGVFPLVAICSLFPYRAPGILARYFKLLFGVKLWPVLWAIVETFHNSGSLEGVLRGTDSASSALFVAVSMYILVPAIAVGVVELSASFAQQALGNLVKVASAAGSAAGAVVSLGYIRAAASSVGSALRVGAMAARKIGA
jgi:hypothetical protein